MTPGVEIPLDSYRLIENAKPISCFVCASENMNAATVCRNCSAPMALTHQINANPVAPKTVAILGAGGAGKTVYLGMLMDMLSRQQGSLHALPRGSFSISLQQATAEALAKGWFPEPTPVEPEHWNWVHCQVHGKSKKNPLDLVLPDMSGEAILAEIEQPNKFPIVRSFLSNCSGVVLLLDAARLHAGDPSQDYSTMKLLTFLGELEQKFHGKNRRDRSRLPVSIVFTKADQCESCFDNPYGFAEAHAAGMLRHCKERFPNHTFFASGVTGACAFREVLGDSRCSIPLRIEPRGLVEPLAWMMSQIA